MAYNCKDSKVNFIFRTHSYPFILCLTQGKFGLPRAVAGEPFSGGLLIACVFNTFQVAFEE